MSLVPVDTSSEVAVTSYLQQARDWLTRAVDETGPEQIAAAKAEIATAAEATKQLGLSKEIQLDAQEMVRRAEYALGKAIRKGQAEGTVLRRGQQVLHRGEDHARPTDFGSPSEVYGNGTSGGLIEFADTPAEDFDAAIDEAKAEGNLSRANVARKAREITGASERKGRRTPLPDAARSAGWDLSKAVERVERIATDDRFAANREQVAPHLRSHLNNAIKVCQDLLDRIDNQQGV